MADADFLSVTMDTGRIWEWYKIPDVNVEPEVFGVTLQMPVDSRVQPQSVYGGERRN